MQSYFPDRQQIIKVYNADRSNADIVYGVKKRLILEQLLFNAMFHDIQKCEIESYVDDNNQYNKKFSIEAVINHK